MNRPSKIGTLFEGLYRIIIQSEVNHSGPCKFCQSIYITESDLFIKKEFND
jgi:hypothetical protein